MNFFIRFCCTIFYILIIFYDTHERNSIILSLKIIKAQTFVRWHFYNLIEQLGELVGLFYINSVNKSEVYILGTYKISNIDTEILVCVAYMHSNI